jgi:FecR protein
MFSSIGMRGALAMVVVLAAGASAMAADDGVWSVSKSSGEVWITTTGAQQASLKPENTLKPGDTIRTGRTGRVLLVRGEETILIAPNSVIGVPTEKKDGLSTTILQQAGSILLEVEKKNVKHFEVETPYLAAVVKGTQFSVTVTAASTSVDVRRGQVEVSDFKSGQIALVLPGQVATSFAHGKFGLSLSGSGTFNPIEQGKPRASSIGRVPVPTGGLPAPHIGDGKVIHALAPIDASSAKLAKRVGAAAARGREQARKGESHPPLDGARRSPAERVQRHPRSRPQCWRRGPDQKRLERHGRQHGLERQQVDRQYRECIWPELQRLKRHRWGQLIDRWQYFVRRRDRRCCNRWRKQFPERQRKCPDGQRQGQ